MATLMYYVVVTLWKYNIFIFHIKINILYELALMKFEPPREFLLNYQSFS